MYISVKQLAIIMAICSLEQPIYCYGKFIFISNWRIYISNVLLFFYFEYIVNIVYKDMVSEKLFSDGKPAS